MTSGRVYTYQELVEAKCVYCEDSVHFANAGGYCRQAKLATGGRITECIYLVVNNTLGALE